MNAKTENGAPERVVWVDYAKAAAIVLIVASHVQHQLLKMGIGSEGGIYHFLDSLLYSFHVPLFFFLSGLFLRASLEKRGLKRLAAEKARTILYPFAVWSLLQTAIEIVLSRTGSEPLPWTELATCLYYPRAHFWFLYALFFMSVISAAVLWLCRRFPYLWLSLMALALFFLSIRFAFGPFADLARNFIFFAGGMVAERFGMTRKIRPARMLWLCFSVLQFVVLEYSFICAGWNSEWFGRMVLAASGIVFSVSLSRAVSKFDVGWLRYIGAKSLPIYVAHVLAAYPLMWIVRKTTEWSGPLSYAAVGMIAGVLLPLLLDSIARRLGLAFLFEWPRRR